MNVLLVGGDLTQGLDGVGDYIRNVAAQLMREGVAVAVLGLNDKRVEVLVSEQVDGVKFLRIPSTMIWKDKVWAARAFAADFSPDIISLNFVPYAWHPKGLPIGFVNRFKSVVGETPAHIMFHELAVGVWEGASVRHKIIGCIQEWAVIRRLAHLPQVKWISTNTIPHQKLLMKWGIGSSVLPLFGNIQIKDLSRQDEQKWWFATVNSSADKFLNVGTFGSVKAGAFNDSVLEALLGEAHRRDKALHVLCAGGISHAGEEYMRSVRSAWEGRITFTNLGRLDAGDISSYLSSLDFGLASTPWVYSAKSGSLIAMLEHGLPVIVSSSELTIRGVTDSGLEDRFGSQVINSRSKDLSRWLTVEKKREKKSLLSEVVRQFACECRANLTQ